jgi:hypothetical protein
MPSPRQHWATSTALMAAAWGGEGLVFCRLSLKTNCLWMWYDTCKRIPLLVVPRMTSMIDASGGNGRKKLGRRKDVDSQEGGRVQGGDIDNLGCNKLACMGVMRVPSWGAGRLRHFCPSACHWQQRCHSRDSRCGYRRQWWAKQGQRCHNKRPSGTATGATACPSVGSACHTTLVHAARGEGLMSRIALASLPS